MVIKNHSTFSQWVFYLKSPDDKELRLPAEGAKNSLKELAGLVSNQIKQFPDDYKERVMADAANMGYDYGSYLKAVIQHQICLRRADLKDLCWESGMGDKLHEFANSIDKVIASSPKPFKAIAEASVKAATKLATGRASKTLYGCASCGGTRTLDPTKVNLGRVGAVNKIIPSGVPR